MQKPNIQQNLQAAAVLKTQQQSHYDALTNTASKEANLKFGSLSRTPSQMTNIERIKVTNPKVYLHQQSQFPNFKFKDGVRISHHEAQLTEANEAQGAETGTGRHGSESNVSHEEAEKVLQMFTSKSHQSTTVSSTLSLESGIERPTSSPPSFSVTQTSAFPAVLAQKDATSSEVVTSSSQTADEDQQAESGFQYPSLSQPGSVAPTEPSTFTLSTSVYFISTSSSSTSSPAASALSLSPPSPSVSASTSSSPSSTRSDMKTQLPNVTLPSNNSTSTELRSHWSEYLNLTMNVTSKPPLLSVSLRGRPVCPYPPVPTHGTFYFRNVENPGPREYRHYIQYACYPGFTLAHGDIHSFCQQGGIWSGITPVCLGR